VTLPDINLNSTPKSQHPPSTRPHQQEARFEVSRKSSIDNVDVLPPIYEFVGNSTDFTRSKSMMRLPSYQVERKPEALVPFGTVGHHGLSPVAEADRETGGDTNYSVVTKRSTKPQLSVLTTRKRDIKQLRKNPEMLFPKMNALIAQGPTEEDESRSSPSSDVNNNKRTAPGSPDCDVSPTEDIDKSRYLNMIQKLTAYLPEHLAKSAQSQIREMTNTDAIYRHKEKLLKREQQERPTDGDSRWKQLESVLCPTRGIQNKWFKRNRSWIMSRNK
jgi:hypothetical protein